MFNKSLTLLAVLGLSIPLSSIALERRSLLPPETHTSIRISNTTDLWERLKESSMGQLWQDDEFQAFLGNPDFENLGATFFSDDDTGQGELFMEEVKMLKGEVVIGMDKDFNDAYLIIALSKEDFERSMELDEQMNSLDPEPITIKKSEFQNVMMVQHIPGNANPEETSTWQAHINNTLIIGPSQEWVERTIIQLKKEDITEPTGDPTLSLNLPVARLLREAFLQEQQAAASPPAVDPERMLEALGLLGIERYTLNLALKENEMVADSRLTVSDMTKGLFSILDTRPANLPSVSFIPEDIASIEVGRFNLLRLWREIPVILAVGSPMAKAQFDMIPMLILQTAGINLEQDILANMETKYVSFNAVSENQAQSIVAVELKDAMAFKNGIETALNAPQIAPQVGQVLEIETFLEETIYQIKSEDPDSAIAFSVTGDYFIYGQIDGVRMVLRKRHSDEAPGRPFERSMLVRSIRETVPPTAFGYSAIDWKKNMKQIVRELQKPTAGMLLQQGWPQGPNDPPPPDLSKLPAASHMASFFNKSITYIEATEDGLHQKTIVKY